MTELYGVIGNPIAHSQSPSIHNPGFIELKIDAVYIRLASRNMEEAVEAVRGMGLKGFNVTSPYKEVVLPLLDSLSEEAAKFGAVNTVTLDQDGLTGYNTDGFGAIRALMEGGADKKKHHFLILGAG